MKITIQLKGDSQLRAMLKRLGSKAPNVLASALYQEAESIMGESKSLVPVDTGNLRGSGHVQQPVITATRASIILGYGGPAAEYAIYVHEDLSAQHVVGQAKYLEQPALEHAKNMDARLAKRIKQFLSSEVR